MTKILFKRQTLNRKSNIFPYCPYDLCSVYGCIKLYLTLPVVQKRFKANYLD